ncbi:MAG: hypothetical protein ACE366_01470 [Bradymonadia bacterium]
MKTKNTHNTITTEQMNSGGNLNMRIRNPLSFRRLAGSAVAGAAVLVCGVSAAQAQQVPSVLPYTGYIANSDGAALNESVDLTFRLYSSPNSDTPVWSESVENVVVDDGVFYIYLGMNSPLANYFLDGSTRYLGVEVNGDGEAEPRQEIGSVPYAMLAGDALRLGGYPAESFLTEEDVTVILESDNYITQTSLEQYLEDQEFVTVVNIEQVLEGDYVTVEELNEAIAGAAVNVEQVTNIINQELGERGYISEARLNEILTERGYQTAAQVNALIDARGYQTANQVNQLIDARGYVTEARVNNIIDNRGYVTLNQVNQAIDARGYVNTDAVNQLIDARGYVTLAQVNQAIDARNYISQNTLNQTLNNYVTVNQLNNAEATIEANVLATLQAAIEDNVGELVDAAVANAVADSVDQLVADAIAAQVGQIQADIAQNAGAIANNANAIAQNANNIANNANGIGNNAGNINANFDLIADNEASINALQAQVADLTNRLTNIENNGAGAAAEPTILGVSQSSSSGKITYGGRAGLAAGRQMCIDTFGAGAHMCSSHEVSLAVAAGNINFNNGQAGDGQQTWTVAGASLQANNQGNNGLGNTCQNLLYNSGDVAVGTTLEIDRNYTSNGGGGNATSDVFKLRRSIPCNTPLPVLCCR